MVIKVSASDLLDHPKAIEFLWKQTMNLARVLSNNALTSADISTRHKNKLYNITMQTRGWSLLDWCATLVARARAAATPLIWRVGPFDYTLVIKAPDKESSSLFVMYPKTNSLSHLQH